MRATHLFASFAALLLAAPVQAAPQAPSRVADLSQFPRGPILNMNARKPVSARTFGAGNSGQGLLGPGGPAAATKKQKSPVIKFKAPPRKLHPSEHVANFVKPDPIGMSLDLFRRMFKCAYDCTMKETGQRLLRFDVMAVGRLLKVWKVCRNSPNCGGGQPLPDPLGEVTPQNLARSAQQAMALIASHHNELGENGMRMFHQLRQELAQDLANNGMFMPLAIAVAVVCVTMIVVAFLPGITVGGLVAGGATAARVAAGGANAARLAAGGATAARLVVVGAPFGI